MNAPQSLASDRLDCQPDVGWQDSHNSPSEERLPGVHRCPGAATIISSASPAMHRQSLASEIDYLREPAAAADQITPDEYVIACLPLEHLMHGPPRREVSVSVGDDRQLHYAYRSEHRSNVARDSSRKSASELSLACHRSSGELWPHTTASPCLTHPTRVGEASRYMRALIRVLT